MLEKIKIAHLSDLHIGYSNNSIDDGFHRSLNKKLRDKILEDLKEANPHIILITGDILNHDAWDKKGFFDEAVKFIQELSVVCNGRLYLAPGNHDIKLLAGNPLGDYRNEILLNERKKFIHDNKTSLLVNYTKLLTQLNRERKYGYQYSYDIYNRIEELGVVVFCLNNTLFAEKGSDINKLYFDTNEIENFEEYCNEKDNGELLVLSLFHHPENYLNYREHFKVNGNKEFVGSLSVIKDKSDLIFHGHTHPQYLLDIDQDDIVNNLKKKFIDCGALHFNFHYWYLNPQFYIVTFNFENRRKVFNKKTYTAFDFESESRINNYIDELHKTPTETTKADKKEIEKKIFHSKIKAFHKKYETPCIQKTTTLESYLHFDDLLKFMFKKEKKVEIETGKVEVNLQDLIQTKDCLVERYYSEIFLGIPTLKLSKMQDAKAVDNAIRLIRHFTHISGTKLFTKLFTVLYKENPNIIFSKAMSNGTLIKQNIYLKGYKQLKQKEIKDYYGNLLNKFEGFFDWLLKQCNIEITINHID